MVYVDIVPHLIWWGGRRKEFQCGIFVVLGGGGVKYGAVGVVYCAIR